MLAAAKSVLYIGRQLSSLFFFFLLFSLSSSFVILPLLFLVAVHLLSWPEFSMSLFFFFLFPSLFHGWRVVGATGEKERETERLPRGRREDGAFYTAPATITNCAFTFGG